ncbi:MAG: hypothetical protein ACRDV4_02490, partial [Acidimicrobiales bacterium]
VGRALDELASVLEPGGTLVAVTNYGDHLSELRQYFGTPRRRNPFAGEDARAFLEARFSTTQEIDCTGSVTFADRAAALAYAQPSAAMFGKTYNLPELNAPLIVRRRPVIFVATK